MGPYIVAGVLVFLTGLFAFTAGSILSVMLKSALVKLGFKSEAQRAEDEQAKAKEQAQAEDKRKKDALRGVPMPLRDVFIDSTFEAIVHDDGKLQLSERFKPVMRRILEDIYANDQAFFEASREVMARTLGKEFRAMFLLIFDFVAPQTGTGFTMPLLSAHREPWTAVGSLLDKIQFLQTWKSWGNAPVVLPNLTTVIDQRTKDEKINRVADLYHMKSWYKTYNKSHLKVSPMEAAQLYFANTPLMECFTTPVEFGIPEHLFFEHTHIVAPPGAGKSNLLSFLINERLNDVARGQASIIVMESNRDLIKSIEGLKRFAPGGDLHGRLVVIDAEDVDYPVAINLFDVGLHDFAGASSRDREALYNSAVSTLNYVFRSLLGAELTPRQSTLFAFTAQLLMEIPDATLDTFLDLMQPGARAKYGQYITRLDEDVRRFFAEKFDTDQEYKKTKQQVADRIYSFKRVRTLARMFAAPRTKLDLYREMGEGKVILINAAKSLLQEDGVELFGGFFVAMILLAAEKRQLLNPADRLPVFVYIDEAQDIIKRDEKFPTILDQARKFRVAMTIAHQRLDQMTPPVLSALYGSTAIKFASRVAEASALARNMGTTPEFIASQPPFHFAAYFRSNTKEAVSLQIPHVDFTKEPRMSSREARAVRDEMRRKYSIQKGDEVRSPEAARPVHVEIIPPDEVDVPQDVQSLPRQARKFLALGKRVAEKSPPKNDQNDW